MYIINTNYGDNGIALLQWAAEQELSPVRVAHIETGLTSPAWQRRVEQAQTFAKVCGFSVATIQATPDFPGLLRDRQRFPTPQFPWCVTFLKALNIIRWLDEVDPESQSTILLSSRRTDGRTRAQLPEHIDDSKHYGGRGVQYPLYAHDQAQRDVLIHRAGFAVLGHRSLECAVCIHDGRERLAQLDDPTRQTYRQLEAALGAQLIKQEEAALLPQTAFFEALDTGCHAPFMCGE